jgi:hypothetical protein
LSKIVKNTTISDITIASTGVTVPASGQYTIPQQDYLMWADPDTITEITTDVNSGDLVINDSIQDLPAADGLEFLRYPDKGLAKVSSDDTTPGYLSTKLIAGALIGITVNSGGANETVTLDAQDAADEGKLKEIGFHDNSQPDVSTSSVTYTIVASFVYGGSTAVGTPTYMKAILHTSATSGDIKIYDVTNGNTIVEKNFTNTTKAIIDLGTLSNIPTGESIFEVQVKRTGGGNAFIGALNLGWV